MPGKKPDLLAILSNWQPHHKGTALAWYAFALGPDFPTVGLNRQLAKRKPQAGAHAPPLVGHYLLKLFEQPALRFGGPPQDLTPRPPSLAREGGAGESPREAISGGVNAKVLCLRAQHDMK